MKKIGNRILSFYWGSGIADDVPALAYYLVLSLAPFALGLTALASLIFGQHLQASYISREITRYLPTSIRSDVNSLVRGAEHDSTRILLLSIAAMLWTSSAAIGVIERCLARLVKAPRHPMIRGRLRNIGFGGVFALLLIFAVAATSLFGGVQSYLPNEVYLPSLLTVFNMVGTFLFCSLIYRFVPRGGISWQAALLGAIPAAVVLQLAPILVGFYFRALAHPATASIFISFAVVLFGCFLLSIGFLVGAGVAAHVEEGKKIK